MTDKDYGALLKVAKVILEKYGVESINAKSAHDFAIESLMECGEVRFVNLTRRIIDALRRDRGRRATGSEGKFVMTRVTNGIVCRKPKPPRQIEEVLDGVDLDKRQRTIAIKLSEGMAKQDVAKLVGVSPGRLSQICHEIRAKMLESGNWNRGYYEANQ